MNFQLRNNSQFFASMERCQNLNFKHLSKKKKIKFEKGISIFFISSIKTTKENFLH